MELDKKSLTVNGNTPELSAGEKPLIRVVHDECTYYANSSQPFFCGDDPANVLSDRNLSVHQLCFLTLLMRCLAMSEMSRVRHDYCWKQIEMDISQTIISLRKLHGPLTFLKGSTLLPQVSFSLTMLPPTTKSMIMH